MQITIKTSGNAVAMSDELRAFVEEKVGKLGKLVDAHDENALAEVELGSSVGGQRTGEVFRAEINLTFVHGFTRAEASRESIHHAIDAAVAEMKRELKKKFGQRRDIVRRGAAKAKEFIQRLGGRS